jgi:[ribosomal protein S5]-alanine N-acetyltransferase
MITTQRLTLIPATVAMIDLDRDGQPPLAAALPADWPPEHHDAGILAFWRAKLAQPGSEGWWLHYLVHVDSNTVVGTAGYKGPPVAGAVESGYSVVPSWQRRGIATEACAGLIAAARERGATIVRAHTLPHLVPSIGVLEKLGFTRDESSEEGAIGFVLRRPSDG